MLERPTIHVIIPAYNEENSIAKVLQKIPKGLVDEVIVCDNASIDQTAENARVAGATVLHQSLRGYGNACLKGMEYVAKKGNDKKPDIIVFLDADYSDHPEEMTQVVEPILKQNADMVIGSRALGDRERGSMTFPQVFGNGLATTLLRLFYGIRFTDLGPFRAIRYDRLLQLEMSDTTYGWTVEMQAKAAKKGFNCVEVPVSYRKRIGVSKISGTIKGTIMAGYKIIWTIFRYL